MSEQPNATKQKTQKKRKHKLEIQVFEADYEKADANNGQPQWRPVRSDPVLDGYRPNIIEVADEQEFLEIQKQYALCEQRIKVIREIDPFVDEPEDNGKAQVIPTNNQAIPVNASSSQPTASLPSLTKTEQIQTQNIVVSPAQNSQTTKPKPKIVTIGDIEVKYDGDKVYQKQWMKLTAIEASNFRVVNDSNNKIVNLNGKHIEAKRWVLVEDSSAEHEDDNVDNLIEG